MRVVAVQLDITWEDKPANLAKVAHMLRAGEVPPGSLVVLPEMFATGFSLNPPATAEGPGGVTERFLSALAAELGVWLLGGLVTLGTDGRCRNEALAFNPRGEAVSRYAKLYPFTFAGEDKVHAPGESVASFDWAGLRVSPLICYDLRFPEAFRASVRRGAGLFAVLANWPKAREEHWATLLRARAIENLAYVVGVNRCGLDPSNAYSGRSCVITPQGITLAEAGSAECLLQAEIDLQALTDYRRGFPALDDMREGLA